MPETNIVFCGSFQAYSSLVLAGLLEAEDIKVVAVVTTPAHDGIPNPVQQLAEEHDIPVLTPTTIDEHTLAELETIAQGQPEILLTAGYGHLLPEAWLRWPTLAALNLHFSVLPKYRGANPAEWALLAGETTTGITLIEMSPEFDTGKLVAQASLKIDAPDTRETVYDKLYRLGGLVIGQMLKGYLQKKPTAEPLVTFFLPPVTQADSPTPYAKRFKREDGLIEWPAFAAAINGKTAKPELVSPQLQKVLTWLHQPLDARFVERATRALAGFPSLWTNLPTAKGEQRMKILSAHLDGQKLVLDQVQLAGKNPSRWAESKNILI